MKKKKKKAHDIFFEFSHCDSGKDSLFPNDWSMLSHFKLDGLREKLNKLIFHLNSHDLR